MVQAPASTNASGLTAYGLTLSDGTVVFHRHLKLGLGNGVDFVTGNTTLQGTTTATVALHGM